MEDCYRDPINPAASCLPMLAQFPIFIALYYCKSHIHRVVAVRRPEHRRQGDALTAGCVLAVYAKLAGSIHVLHGCDEMERNIMMVLPLVFIAVVCALPDGPHHLLDDDEKPLDSRAGLVARRARTPAPKGGASAPAAPKRSSRTPAKAEPATDNGAAQDTANRPATPRVREAEEGRLPPLSDEVSVEATGETVGEAK